MTSRRAVALALSGVVADQVGLAEVFDFDGGHEGVKGEG